MADAAEMTREMFSVCSRGGRRGTVRPFGQGETGAVDPAARRRNDRLLLGGMVAVSLVLFAASALTRGQKAGRAVITQDGRVLAELSLTEDAVFTVLGDGTLAAGNVPAEGRNVVEIRDGGCQVTEADCPDGICRERGRISKRGESIICLPHRLAIEVKGGEAAEADTLAR